MLAKIHSFLEKISTWSVWCGGGALLLCAIMVTLDVTARKIFNVTLSGSDEITGYVFAASTTWAYSYCLFNRANVRIDELYNRLGPWPRAILDLVGLLLLLLYIGVLASKAIVVYQETLEFNATAQTTLATPLWIPQIFWVSGLVFFFLSLLFVTIYTTVAVIKKDLPLVARLAGVRTVEEELEQETHGTVVVTARASAEAGSK